MGKRIIQQRRGRGTSTYRVRKKAFKQKIRYPKLEGKQKAKVIKLIASNGHSAPLAKIRLENGKIFYNHATEKMFEGQEIEINGIQKKGNIMELKSISPGTTIYNIEKQPGDGGKFMRAGGTSAIIGEKDKGKVKIIFPSKKQIILNADCKATIGVTAGHERLEKPLLKAGKKYFIMKSKGKLWPRTSAVSMNAIDHPFGSGRGKNIAHGSKGKIPKINSPPGAKVGLLRPKRTGRRKK